MSSPSKSSAQPLSDVRAPDNATFDPEDGELWAIAKNFAAMHGNSGEVHYSVADFIDDTTIPATPEKKLRKRKAPAQEVIDLCDDAEDLVNSRLAAMEARVAKMEKRFTAAVDKFKTFYFRLEANMKDLRAECAKDYDDYWAWKEGTDASIAALQQSVADLGNDVAEMM
jgi:hypothetical protein